MTTPILLTEPEAAEQLRLSPRTLRKARMAGDLRCILIGRSVRYTVEDLESYVEQLRQVQSACPAQPTRVRSVSKRGGVVVPFSERNARR